jgi:hypothetical protein
MVETVWLKTLYVLFFIELGTRRVHFGGCTANPVGDWVTQEARNLARGCSDAERPARFLVRGRDHKFSRAFDEVFQSEAVRVLRTPVRAPRANAYAERWVRAVRTECLDWLLILNRAHLEQVLRIYVRHYNHQRPHRGLGLVPPTGPHQLPPTASAVPADVYRRDLLGGLLHEYYQVAA